MLQYACSNSRAGNPLGSIFAGEIEIRVPERTKFFKTACTRFVIFEFRRRDRNPLKILRFEMLKQQDELLWLSIWQRPNQQSIDEAQYSRSRADGESDGENCDGCEGRLLQ